MTSTTRASTKRIWIRFPATPEPLDLHNRHANRRVLDLLGERAARDRILDIWFGPGWALEQLATQVVGQVAGIDAQIKTPPGLRMGLCGVLEPSILLRWGRILACGLDFLSVGYSSRTFRGRDCGFLLDFSLFFATHGKGNYQAQGQRKGKESLHEYLPKNVTGHATERLSHTVRTQQIC